VPERHLVVRGLPKVSLSGAPEPPRRRAAPQAVESSLNRPTGCIETTPNVANALAKFAFGYISRQLDTCQPDLGSGAARRGGSSPSSCTVVGAFPPSGIAKRVSPAPLKCPPSGITKRVIQRAPPLTFGSPTPKKFRDARARRGGSSPSSCTRLRSQGSEAAEQSEGANGPERSTILGLFADDPALMDEVCESATQSRERDPLRRRG
jgi:hypothetical protein